MDQELIKRFTEQTNRNEVVEILKELFDSGKIKLITDLTRDEISLLTRINSVAEMKGLGIWKDVINEYVSLQLSRDRKSRKEIIEGIKGYNTRISGLQKLLPSNWGRGGV